MAEVAASPTPEVEYRMRLTLPTGRLRGKICAQDVVDESGGGVVGIGEPSPRTKPDCRSADFGVRGSVMTRLAGVASRCRRAAVATPLVAVRSPSAMHTSASGPSGTPVDSVSDQRSAAGGRDSGDEVEHPEQSPGDP